MVVRRCGPVEREPAGDFGVYEHVEVLCGFLPSRFSSSGIPARRTIASYKLFR